VPRNNGQRDPLAWVSLAFILATALAAIYLYGFAPTRFVVAAPPAGTELGDLFEAIAHALERERAEVRLRIVPIGSDDAITQAMHAGEVDLAAVRADRAFPASSLAVLELHRYMALMLARPGAGIKSLGDLRGRKVGKLAVAPEAAILTSILRWHRIGPQDLEIVGIERAEAIADAVRSSRLDALFVLVPRGSLATAEALQATARAFGRPPLVLSIPEAKPMAAGNPAFATAEVGVGELSATPLLPAQKIEVLTIPELLVARRQLSPRAVEALTKAIFALRPSLSNAAPAAGRIAGLTPTRGGAFEVHPGAAVFYNAAEKGVLDRYSDIIWLVLFGASSVVSGAVWLRRRLSPGQRETIRGRHAELVALMTTGREAGEPSELDQIERRIDAIVAEISEMVFNGDLDPDEQPAFEIAIARIDRILDARRHQLGAAASGRRAAERTTRAHRNRTS
jgi:TRAP-type uncharacterized transport system substrate-binding protein